MSRQRWLQALVLALALIVTMAPTAAPVAAPVALGGDDFISPAPETDPFYSAPADLAALAPGTIVRTRTVALGVLGAAVAVDAWQIVFRSTGAQGQPQVGVTTVAVPKGRAPGRGRSLLSYQLAEDSMSSKCAPSHQLLHGTWPSNPGVHAELLVAMGALNNGHVVVLPDHEGPDSAYPSGPVAGRITLDSIRAVERFAPARLAGPRTRVGLMGYSGGALASGWAAELAPTYASELNIVGVAQGGVPVDLANIVAAGNKTLLAGIGVGGVLGLARAHPDFREFLRKHVTPYGKQRMAALKDACLTEMVLGGAFSDVNLVSDLPDVMKDPFVLEVLARERRGQTMPTAPQYVFHSVGDIMPVADVDDLVQRYCAAGVPVRYHRDLISAWLGSPELAHLLAMVFAVPAAAKWMDDRLRGVPAESGCHTRTAFTSLDEPGVLTYLGNYLKGLPTLFGYGS